MNRFFCVFLLLIFTICIACQNVSLNPYTDDSAEWEGNILPHQNVPDFVKRQWHDIASTSLFPLPERNWLETGLPPGLEEQVWKAWAPGAKRRWQNISPGYTNVIYDAKIDNGVISLILDGAGLVQSKDSGRTWQPVSHHLTYFGGSAGYISFDISPANPDIIAVAGAHIDRTTNGGRSWSPVIDQVLPAFKSQRIIQGRSTMSGAMAFGFLRFNADGSRVFASPGGFGHTFTPRGDIETEMAGWLRRKFIYIGDGNVSNFKAVDLGPFAGIRCILPHFSDPNLVFASFSDGSVYICRNAKVKKPVFTEFEKPAWLNGLQAIYMDVSPEDPGTLLLTMSEQGKAEGWPKSRIILAKVSGSTLDCTEIKIRTKDEYLSFASAKWNPRNPKQVFVGSKWEYNTFRVSDDGMKSFRKLHLPEELFPAEHTTGYSCPRSFVFDRKSDLSIVYSVTGAWLSHDEFRNAGELVMTHDYDRNIFGNKGVGFAECAMSICIRRNYTYFSTTDHGAWRSNGHDTSQWLKISDNPGMPKDDKDRLADPIAVSEDETIIYLVSHLDGWSDTYHNHKLMFSGDMGETWQDVTEVLGLGPVIEDGIQWIFIDPGNPQNQWVFSGEKLYISIDKGKSFKSSSKTGINRPFAWDPVHKILYTGDYARILRSNDMGFTWSSLPAVFSGMVYSLDVLANGDLVAADDGRLLVIPFDRIDSDKIEQSMIRLTIGESIAAAASGQRTFKPVICRGRDILVFTDNGWNHSTCVRNLGPLLSRDGGKTFNWIVYDLPCTDGPYGVDLRNGRIIIGNRGIHQLDLK